MGNGHTGRCNAGVESKKPASGEQMIEKYNKNSHNACILDLNYKKIESNAIFPTLVELIEAMRASTLPLGVHHEFKDVLTQWKHGWWYENDANDYSKQYCTSTNIISESYYKSRIFIEKCEMLNMWNKISPILSGTIDVYQNICIECGMFIDGLKKNDTRYKHFLVHHPNIIKLYFPTLESYVISGEDWSAYDKSYNLVLPLMYYQKKSLRRFYIKKPREKEEGEP